MTRCRVSEEELAHDHKQMALDAMYDADFALFKCKECDHKFKLKHMFKVLDYEDAGVCEHCAKNREVREDWG